MEFTFDAYARLIELIKENDYTITNYHNYKSVKNPAIIRHDVDLSLSKSVKLAQMENEWGIQSTYFILISSDLYNIGSLSSIKQIKEIRNYGHEIGLHFDETKYYIPDNSNWAAEMQNMIFDEIEIMEKILGCQIRTVSMHRPSEKTLNSDISLGDIVNSYSKEFFQNFKYVSDSSRHWRENVEEIIKSQRYKKLHILTHAFWYNETEKNITESISEFVNAANIDRYYVMKESVLDISQIMKVSEVKR